MSDIVQHCFGAPGRGGPATALQRLLDRSSEHYDVIWQREPAGGISIRLLFRFIAELRRYRPNLVHVRGLGNEGFHAALAARLAGVRHVLVSVHGTHRDLKGGSKFRRFLVSRVLEPITLMLATNIVTVCAFASRRDFLRRFRSKMLHPVPNGVFLPDADAERALQLRKDLGIRENSVLLVTVSRLTHEKGYGDLARAVELLEQGGYAFDLLVIGDGDTDGSIRSLFSSGESVGIHFIGHTSDVGKYLAASDCFVFPTWHENLSNALLEAMAYGLPAIATDVGGNTEVLAEGGGILVPPHDPHGLAEAIGSLIDEPELLRSLGRRARATIEAHYTVDIMVAGWENAYRQALGVSA
jgi:glycosyltransferase involved in cell wall biosynthesis